MSDPAFESVKVAISLLAFVVSIIAWHTAQASLERQRRPILVFDHSQARGWSVRNVGAGPALNVVIARKSAQGEWDCAVVVPPIASGQDHTLHWLSAEFNDTLACDYADYRGVLYGSLLIKLRQSAHDVPQLPSGLASAAVRAP